MRREFFTLGEEHVERLWATVKEDLDPEFTHRSEDSLENLSGDFGFHHSFIVFQYIAARRQSPPRDAPALVRKRSWLPPLRLTRFKSPAGNACYENSARPSPWSTAWPTL